MPPLGSSLVISHSDSWSNHLPQTLCLICIENITAEMISLKYSYHNVTSPHLHLNEYPISLRIYIYIYISFFFLAWSLLLPTVLFKP